MRHLVIRNFGPLKEAVIDLERVNLLIGMQSSGKSCVLRAACFCTWVEKRIMLMQSAEYFKKGTRFMDHFVAYYKMESYVKPDTYISYESSYVKFSYDSRRQDAPFCYEPQQNSWRYKRPQVSYIPSDRNVVSLFRDYRQLPNAGTHLQDFMTEWDRSRRGIGMEQNVLGLGVKYYYDADKGKDIVVLKDGKEIELSETSSGMQSMMPLFVHLDYLTSAIHSDPFHCVSDLSLEKAEEVKAMLSVIYKRCRTDRTEGKRRDASVTINGKNYTYSFESEKARDKFNGYVMRLLRVDHAEIFLEEPENNLFPPTQSQMVNWLLDRIGDEQHADCLFVATHSPYVLNYMLQENLSAFRLMLTYPCEDGSGLYCVKTATEEELQQIYDNGSDAFFNFEAFTH